MKPGRAALRRAFELHRRTLVEVIGPRRSGTGVIVGANGQVLTTVDFVGLYEAKIRHDGQLFPAKVLLANAQLKIALLQFDPPAPLPSTPVRLVDEYPRGAWVLGIQRAPKGDPVAITGQITAGPTGESPFLSIDFPLTPGSPVIDAQGKLLAIAIGRRAGSSQVRALPLAAVKEQLSAGAPP